MHRITHLTLGFVIGAVCLSTACGDSTLTDGGGGGGRDGNASDGGQDATQPPDACIADLQTDPHNCGRCGRDCLGGACQAGMCQPVEVAGPQGLITDIAVDGTNVYWVKSASRLQVADGEIRAAPRLGGTLSTLAAGQPSPFRLAVDATHVYWTSLGLLGPRDVICCAGSLMSLPISGGMPTRLAGSPGAAISLAVRGSDIFWINMGTLRWNGSAWVNQSDGAVYQTPTIGGTTTTLASQLLRPSTGLITDGSSLYWTTWGNTDALGNTTEGAIWKLPATAGAPTALAVGLSNPYVFQATPTALYWFRLPTAPLGPDGGILRMPLGGGSSEELVGGAAIIGVDAGDTDLYWSDWGSGTTTDGAIKTMPLAGGPIRSIAVGQDRPGLVRVDNVAVYWSTGFVVGFWTGMNQRILKVAR